MAEDGSAISTSSTGAKSAVKDPGATLDFSFDWSDWLSEVGSVLTDHAFVIVDPPGAADPLVEVNTLRAEGIVTAFVKGGTVGRTHKLTCRITDSSTPPRIDERTLSIKIKER